MSIANPVSVLVAVELDSLRASIIAALDGEHEAVVIGEARDGVEAIDKAQALAPDVVIMDFAEAYVEAVLASNENDGGDHHPKILVLSQSDREEDIRSAMNSGASGYLAVESLLSDLPKAIRVVHQGGHFFSPHIARRIVSFYLKAVSAIP